MLAANAGREGHLWPARPNSPCLYASALLVELPFCQISGKTPLTRSGRRVCVAACEDVDLCCLRDQFGNGASSTTVANATKRLWSVGDGGRSGIMRGSQLSQPLIE
jgi:hypothetical protein